MAVSPSRGARQWAFLSRTWHNSKSVLHFGVIWAHRASLSEEQRWPMVLLWIGRGGTPLAILLA
jgi:hypothetical protein